jgi:hypothetical protein
LARNSEPGTRTENANPELGNLELGTWNVEYTTSSVPPQLVKFFTKAGILVGGT